MNQRRRVEDDITACLKQQVTEQEQLANSNGVSDEFIDAVRISRLEGLDECNDLRLLVVHLVELFEHCSVGLECLLNTSDVLAN